jgi:hypothetical protein
VPLKKCRNEKSLKEDFKHLKPILQMRTRPSNRNQRVVKALSHLDDIDFDISNTEADVVGYAHEYRIGESTSGAGKKNPASSIPRKRYNLTGQDGHPR